MIRRGVGAISSGLILGVPMQKTPVMKPRISTIEATRRTRDELLFALRSLEGNDRGFPGVVVLHFLQHLLAMGSALGLRLEDLQDLPTRQ